MPESISIDVINDDDSIVDTITADSNHEWKYSIEVPEFKADGVTPYKYKVQEHPIEGYLTTYKDSNANQYNATKITFGSTFRTYNSSDYVSIYYVVNGKTYQYRYNGADYNGRFYGTGSYSAAGKTIYVPSTDVYVYWSANSYRSDYGFDIVDMTPVNYVTTYYNYTANLPAGTPIEITEGNYPKTDHNYTAWRPVLWHFNPLSSRNPSYGLYDIVNYKNEIAVSGRILWSDDGYESHRPASVDVSIFNDYGVKCGTSSVTADDNWEYSFSVPEYDPAMKKFNYRIQSETELDEYLTRYTRSDSVTDSFVSYSYSGYNNIIYFYNLVDVAGRVTWEEAELVEIPDELQLSLYDNDDHVIATTTASAENDWEYNFGTFPTFDEDGDKNQYRVSEQYVKYYIPNNNGFDIENQVNVRYLDCTKVWDETISNDEISDSITLNIYDDRNRLYDTYVAEKGAQDREWHFTIPVEAMYKELYYDSWSSYGDFHIREQQSDRFAGFVTYDRDADEYIITNYPNTTVISGEKLWDNVPKDERPASISIDLMQNGKLYKSQTVKPNADGRWLYSFDNVPIRDELFSEYAYTVREQENASYVATYGKMNPEHGMVVSYSNTGSYNRGCLIYFVYNGNVYSLNTSDYIEPGAVHISAWIPGNMLWIKGDAGTVTINAAENDKDITWDENNNQLVVDGLNATLEISETELNNDASIAQYVDTQFFGGTQIYDISAERYTRLNYNRAYKADFSTASDLGQYDLVNHPNNLTISGQKEWDDAGYEAERPESITVNLLRNGNIYRSQTVAADENGNWLYTFTNLPKYDAAYKEYDYNVVEEYLPGYQAMVNQPIIDAGVNIHVQRPESYSGNDWYPDFDVYFFMDGSWWSGRIYLYTSTFYIPSNIFYVSSNAAPSDITITKNYAEHYLYRNNDAIDIDNCFSFNKTYTPPEGESYEESFQNFSGFPVEGDIPYGITVTADKEKWYRAFYPTAEKDSNFYNIKNVYQKERIAGQKFWDVDNESIIPDKIRVLLYRDEELIGVKTVTAANEWKYDFGTVGIYAEDGHKYTYHIEEEEIPGFTAKYAGINGENGLIVTVNGSNQTGHNQFTDYACFAYGGVVWDISPQNIYGVSESFYIPSKEFYSYGNYQNQPSVDITIRDATAAEKDQFLDKYQEVVTSEDIGSWCFDQNGFTYGAVDGSTDAKTYFESSYFSGSGSPLEEIQDTEAVLRNNNYTGSYAHYYHFTTDIFDHSLEKYDIKNICRQEKIAGQKFWDVENDSDIPEGITVRLYRDDLLVDTKTVTSKDNWKYDFGYLAQTADDGHMYHYRVEEEPVNGFITQYGGLSGENGIIITVNGKLPEQGYSLNDAYIFNYNDIVWEMSQVDSYRSAYSVYLPVADFYARCNYGNQDADVFIRDATPEEKEEFLAQYAEGTASEDISNWYFKNGGYAFQPSGVQSDAKTAFEQSYAYDKTVDEIQKTSFVFSYNGDSEHLYHFNADAFDQNIGKYDIKNSATPKTAVTGKKLWESSITEKPNAITVMLMRNGIMIDSKKVTADDEWEYTFDGLEKYDSNGNEYTYNVKEAYLNGYEPVYSNVSGESGLWLDFSEFGDPEYDITFIYDGKLLSAQPTSHAKIFVPVSEFWITSGEQNYQEVPITDASPADLEVFDQAFDAIRNGDTYCYYMNVYYKKRQVDTDDQTRTDETFEHYELENTTEQGVEWTEWSVVPFMVYEDNRPIHFDASVLDHTIGKYDIKNTKTDSKETITIAGTKIWDDEGYESQRPDSVTVLLYQDGQIFTAASVTEKENWEYEFNVPKQDETGHEYVYSIDEVPVGGYKTVQYKPSGEHGLILKAETGCVMEAQLLFEFNGQVYSVLSAGQDMVYIPSDEFWYPYGGIQAARYNILEATASEQDAFVRYFEGLSTDDQNSFIYNDSGYSQYETVTDFQYDWDHNTNGWIDVEIDSCYWKIPSWDEMVSLYSGETPRWHYKVSEESFNIGRYDIKNVAAVETIHGTKTWSDAGFEDCRPDSITVVLYQNGEAFKTKEITKEDGWQYEFTVPKADQNGNDYSYSVNEVPVDGYKTKLYKPSGAHGLIIRGDNSLSRCEVDLHYVYNGSVYCARTDGNTMYIPANEFWVDPEPSYDVPLKLIISEASAATEEAFNTFYDGLADDGSTTYDPNYFIYDTVEYSRVYDNLESFMRRWAENSYNCVDNEIDSSEWEIITSTVWQALHTDGRIPRYHYNGGTGVTGLGKYDIVNISETIAISGTKIWDDNGYEDERPENITVVLYRNGKAYKTKEVSKVDEWKYTFSVPKFNSDGEQYRYSVGEIQAGAYQLKTYKPSGTYGLVLTSDAPVEESGIYFYYNGHIYETSLDRNTSVYIPSSEFWSEGEWETDKKTNITIADATEEEQRVFNDFYNDISTGENAEFTLNSFIFDGSDYNSSYETMAEFISYWNGDTNSWADVEIDDDFWEILPYEDWSILYNNKEPRFHYTGVGGDSSIGRYDLKNTLNTTTISGEKTWENTNKYVKPDSITVQLFRNNVLYKTKEVSENKDGCWVYSFTVPEADEKGQLYNYSIAEATTDGYTPQLKMPSGENGLWLYGNANMADEEALQVGFVYKGCVVFAMVENSESTSGKIIYIPTNEFYLGTYYEGNQIGIEKFQVVDATAADKEKFSAYFDRLVSERGSIDSETMGISVSDWQAYYNYMDGTTDFTSWANNWLADNYPGVVIQEANSSNFVFDTSLWSGEGALGMHYISHETDLGDFDIRNVYNGNLPDTVPLTISNTVRNNINDENREFEYSITLLDRKKPITGYLTYEGSKTGRLLFDKNGTANFALKDGETITFPEMLVGANYAITQKEYMADGYETASTKASGKITDSPTTAAFVNTRKTYTLNLREVTTGNFGDKTKAFTYKVTSNGVTQTYSLSSGEDVNIEIIHGSDVTIKQIFAPLYKTSYAYNHATTNDREITIQSVTDMQSVVFTNSLDMAVPTAVDILGHGWLALIISAEALLIIWFIKRKKRSS